MWGVLNRESCDGLWAGSTCRDGQGPVIVKADSAARATHARSSRRSKVQKWLLGGKRYQKTFVRYVSTSARLQRAAKALGEVSFPCSL